LAVVSLNQPQAQATPYFWSFNTLGDRGSVVVAKRRQHGVFVEFVGSNTSAAINKINSYETYLSNMGVSVTQF
jgi:hypothetical protein